MEFKWGDSIWKIMLVQRPSDTHLSQSSTPGGESPLARDNGNKLVTQAVLFDGSKAVLGVLSVGVVAGATAVKAAPHVKSRAIRLKSKLSRQTGEISDVEAPVPLTVVVEAEPEQPAAPRLRAL